MYENSSNLKLHIFAVAIIGMYVVGWHHFFLRQPFYGVCYVIPQKAKNFDLMAFSRLQGQKGQKNFKNQVWLKMLRIVQFSEKCKNSQKISKSAR